MRTRAYSWNDGLMRKEWIIIRRALTSS